LLRLALESNIAPMDQVVIFGVPLFVLTVRSFVPALALAVFAYEAASSRAERHGDARWLLVSLAGAVLAAFVLEVESSDGAGGIVGPILEATLGAAFVGLIELGSWLAAGRSAQRLRPSRSTRRTAASASASSASAVSSA
jgi:hypothetical protein